jgi:hypothetical protein
MKNRNAIVWTPIRKNNYIATVPITARIGIICPPAVMKNHSFICPIEMMACVMENVVSIK